MLAITASEISPWDRPGPVKRGKERPEADKQGGSEHDGDKKCTNSLSLNYSKTSQRTGRKGGGCNLETIPEAPKEKTVIQKEEESKVGPS